MPHKTIKLQFKSTCALCFGTGVPVDMIDGVKTLLPMPCACSISDGVKVEQDYAVPILSARQRLSLA